MADVLYIGLMSGTSTDGVDAVLARFGQGASDIALLGHCHIEFDPALRATLLSLNLSGADELHRAAIAANSLARQYALAVQELLLETATDRSLVAAIGAHGQTVRHRPGEFDGVGYTLQLLNGALLAELTGIDAVCDFRSRDVAAGGQGAPLVPAFHRAVFGQDGTPMAILNIGGIANLTLLDGNGCTRGFDCGPGNILLDLWASRHLGRDFDECGRWASGGSVDQALLSMMLADPYFERLPPKSTGRDQFNTAWLDAHLKQGHRERPAATRDVQSTLAELTAQTAANALRRHLPQAQKLLICGGGAFNADLCHRISALLPTVQVESTEASGVPPMQVEAAAFAWLAFRFDRGLPGNLPAVTGARADRILGCRYPA